jgi:ABC-type dipeptide/oligopeptide/nickel transport system permease component
MCNTPEYIKGLVTGDMGKSIRTQHLVGKDLVRYFPATLGADRILTDIRG